LKCSPLSDFEFESGSTSPRNAKRAFPETALFERVGIGAADGKIVQILCGDVNFPGYPILVRLLPPVDSEKLGKLRRSRQIELWQKLDQPPIQIDELQVICASKYLQPYPASNQNWSELLHSLDGQMMSQNELQLVSSSKYFHLCQALNQNCFELVQSLDLPRGFSAASDSSATLFRREANSAQSSPPIISFLTHRPGSITAMKLSSFYSLSSDLHEFTGSQD
jgi:hypothetical protein